MPDEAYLLDAASAVAEGTSIDWDQLDRASSDERQRSLIHELRVLERIAHAMRTDSDASGPAPRPDIAHEPIERWGHLRVIEELGHGTYGEVYRAWDEKLECEVALKIAKPTGLPEVDAANALKEARLLARVRHPNVVRVYGADCHADRFGVWMELVAGRTLEQVLAASGPMSAQEVTHIGVDLSQALAAVHGAGLLHRDVKATNVMREEGGRLLLMDFGAGRLVPTADDPVRGMAGTPGYMAPELFLGEHPSAASDVYSLGVLLYHLVTGSYPVDVQSLAAANRAHQRKERRLLRDARPDLSSSFIDVIERALSFNPTERYATAGAFGNALAAAAGIAQPRIEPATPPRPQPRLGWKLMVPVVAAGLVVLAIAARVVWNPETAGPPPSSVSSPNTNAPAAAPAAPDALPAALAAYRVEAAFYALRDGQQVRLAPGSRVAPGDKLFLNLDVSRPVFVYIVNQDDLGATHLLFPLPGQRATNPLSMGQKQLPGPGARDGKDLYWEVTTAGGAEHFFVYVAPERQVEFEKLLVSIPRATLGREVTSAPLSREAVGVLRAVGGLTTAGTPGRSTLTALNGLDPLPAGPDSASGLWARQITLVNPAK